MTAYGDTKCKMCDNAIKDGDEHEVIRIHGKYHNICRVCYSQIYNHVKNEIIKKI